MECLFTEFEKRKSSYICVRINDIYRLNSHNSGLPNIPAHVGTTIYQKTGKGARLCTGLQNSPHERSCPFPCI